MAQHTDGYKDMSLRFKLNNTSYLVMTFCQGTSKNGIQVAVKALSAESQEEIDQIFDGDRYYTEFQASKLVELVGCCAQGANLILLIESIT